MSKNKSVYGQRKISIAISSFLFMNSVVLTLILIPHCTRLMAGPFDRLKSYISVSNIQEAERELTRLKTTYGPESELQSLEADLLRLKGNENIMAGKIPEAAQNLARSRTLEFPEIRAALRDQNWSRAAGLYSLLSPEEKNDPAGRLLLAELRIGQGETAYNQKELYKAREYYREAFSLWPNHPQVRKRYDELMALSHAELTPRPAATPAKQKAFVPVPKASPPAQPVQIFIMNGERGPEPVIYGTQPVMESNLPSQAQIGGGGIGIYEGSVLVLLLLANLQLLMIWIRGRAGV